MEDRKVKKKLTSDFSPAISKRDLTTKLKPRLEM